MWFSFTFPAHPPILKQIHHLAVSADEANAPLKASLIQTRCLAGALTHTHTQARTRAHTRKKA